MEAVATASSGRRGAFETGVLPGGAETSMAIDEPFQDARELRFVVRTRWGGEWPEQGSLVFAQAAEDPMKSRLVFTVPPTGTFWHKPIAFLVVACGKDSATPVFLVEEESYVSSRKGAMVVAGAAVAFFYLAVAVFVWWRRRHEAPYAQAGWLRRLDPVFITAGYNGYGSVSKLQIFFFTLIVAGLLLYFLVRMEVLAGLSEDVLLLLGIAGAGTTGAKLAAVGRRRLTFSNWAWLVNRGWITQDTRKKKEPPSWGDLLIEDGELDIYKFQMLIFSVVVGVALLSAGLTELAQFEISDELLGVLGISQVVYVGGKLVTPPTFGELDAVLKELRQAETDLMTQDQKAQRAGPEDAAAREAAEAAYIKFRGIEEKARTMVKSVFALDTLPPPTQPSPPR
jgi:hypothetical protein